MSGASCRIAVLGDVHANAGAYRGALGLARERGFDRLVLLGDLLTYGAEPLDVLDLTWDVLHRDDAVLIAGNHDQLYFDLAHGSRAASRLPGWIRESVERTAEALGGYDFERALPWARRHACEGVLFAHANPFRYGDWTYLEDDAARNKAAGALAAERLRVGVFGHTHRAGLATRRAGGGWRTWAFGAAGARRRRRLGLGDGAVNLLNAGSIGQPRDVGRAATVLFLDVKPDRLEASFERVAYDVDAHRRAVAGAGLTPATTERLLAYCPESLAA